MQKSYNTHYKDRIKNAIKEFNGEHFTAENLFAKIRSDGENIGSSTVYRHLDRLVNEGFVRKYVSDIGESACYQQSEHCGEHFHLKCEKCGKLQHLSCDLMNEINSHVLSDHGFSIDPSKTVFYGLCKECQEH